MSVAKRDVIPAGDDALSVRLAGLYGSSLARIFEEISDWHETSVLPEDSELRKLADWYAKETGVTYTQSLSLVERCALQEMARRFHNSVRQAQLGER